MFGPGMGDKTVRQSMAPEHRKTLFFFGFAVALASIAGAQYGNQSRGVTLYRDLNFTGTSQTFSDDIPDLRGSYVGNDNATSVRISSGCRARLYADVDYKGAYIEVEQDVSDLRRSPVGNDTVTSLRVRCEGGGDGWSDGGTWPGGGTRRGVTVYRDLNFSGASQSFSNDVADLRSSFVGNDTATSVRVERGCRARLYADANFGGSYIDVDQDISDLRGSPVGNDKVSSMRVRCDQSGGDWSGGGGWDGDTAEYGVTLFRDLDFSGTRQTFSDDVPDLRGSYIGNDTTTSVRVSRGCRARLYVEADYRGNHIEVDRDISDLRGSQVGNDTVTSMQVRCEGTGGGWGGGDSGWGSSHRVTLYEDTHFRGAAYSFDSDVGDLRSTFGANDEASSVRLAPGCTARLYADPQFRGHYTETRRDISDLRGSQVGNDSISSFQIRCQ